MPKRIEGVSARLLDCAREEFLKKGFRDASIRDIASKAKTSARAVYTRFPNKEGLFSALVEPVAQEFMDMFQTNMTEFWSEQISTAAKPVFSADATDIYVRLIDYAYHNRDEFLLILRHSEGTRYENFTEQLADLNYKQLKNHSSENATDNFLTTLKLTHMLTCSFYSGLFAPLLQNMNREEAHYYIQKLCDFFVYGVQGLYSE